MLEMIVYRERIEYLSTPVHLTVSVKLLPLAELEDDEKPVAFGEILRRGDTEVTVFVFTGQTFTIPYAAIQQAFPGTNWDDVYLESSYDFAVDCRDPNTPGLSKEKINADLLSRGLAPLK
ncbi:MAG: hypothetical protein MUE40_02035 [Anaerolineae bacterium]|jgi:hypothetical protein|nr:hypothetical protein [Anaerolineae bacterium]